MANSTQIISSIISSLDKKIIELEKRDTINVTMRIDEMVPYLKEVLALAKDDQSGRKFDLTENKTGSCSVSYSVGGESVSTGSNVLSYGDELTISVAPSTGYTITSLKVNGKNFTSGNKIKVDTDITVTVVATLDTYNLTVTPAEHSTITVTKGGNAVTPGTDAVSYGDTLRISATADEGYTITSLNINGTDYVGDQTITVTTNVTVTTTVIADEEPQE